MSNPVSDRVGELERALHISLMTSRSQAELIATLNQRIRELQAELQGLALLVRVHGCVFRGVATQVEQLRAHLGVAFDQPSAVQPVVPMPPPQSQTEQEQLASVATLCMTPLATDAGPGPRA